MAGKKQCNAIVHSVYMGDGFRAYYEKPDIITFYGVRMSLTEAAVRAFLEVGKMKLRERRTAVLAGIFGQEPVWPPHNLLCDCPECTVRHAHYDKGLRS